MTCKLCGKELQNGKEYCVICDIKRQDPNGEKIDNYEGLVRRADKMIREYDRYPLMPEGNLSVEYIENVFNFNPLFVLDDLKKQVGDMLLEKTDFRYSERELSHILEATYKRREEEQKSRIYNIIKNNFSNYLNTFSSYTICPRYHMDLRPVETQIFYYAYSLYYIAKELNFSDGFLTARQVLKAIDMLHCEKSNNIDGFRKSGKMLDLAEFSRDKKVYDKLMTMIEDEINNNCDDSTKQKLEETKALDKNLHKTGKIMCYVSLALNFSHFFFNPFFIFSIISIIVGSKGIKKIKESGNSDTKIGKIGILWAIASMVYFIIYTIILNLTHEPGLHIVEMCLHLLK